MDVAPTAPALIGAPPAAPAIEAPPVAAMPSAGTGGPTPPPPLTLSVLQQRNDHQPRFFHRVFPLIKHWNGVGWLPKIIDTASMMMCLSPTPSLHTVHKTYFSEVRQRG
eukprot:EG_transcript_27134